MAGTSGARVQATKRARLFVVGSKFVAADNEIRKLWIATRPCKVIAVTFETEAALGASLGIDVLNGGADGAQTDLIAACADNLNGLEEILATANNEMADGFSLNVRFDDYSVATDCTINVTLEEYGS